ncbi:MAG: ATP-binding protein [Planctomycetota bacterium]
MVIPIRSIADLLQMVDGAPDDSGGLASLARLLFPFECPCIFLADGQGRLIAAEGQVFDRGAQRVPRLVRQVVARLGKKSRCAFLIHRHDQTRIAFGLRTAEDRDTLIVGGLLVPHPNARVNLGRRRASLAACAELTHRLLRTAAEQRKLRVENRHLRAEHCTLKAAHTEATIEAIREREERLALEGERIALEQFLRAAENANASKSAFLAGVAHEIRTPMTAILGFTDVLLEEITGAEQQKSLSTIKRNGEYLLEIINDVLDIAKIEAGKLEVERVPCSPVEILDDVLALMRQRAEAKGLNFTAEIAGAMPECVLTDPTRVRQILINLVGNAIKFTQQGEVRVVGTLLDGASSEPRLQFEVTDTGIGIEPTRLTQLFRPFTQGDSSISRKHGGTGLGLVICKRLAEMLGGDIQVTSTLGEGSSFRVALPAGPIDQLPRLAEAPSARLRRRSASNTSPDPMLKLNARILLAEDSADNQRVIAFFLRKSAAQVEIVDNGKAAVDALLAEQSRSPMQGSEPFDCVLLDIDMPLMNGLEAARQFRLHGYRGPLVALTAHAMTHEVQRCLDAGFDCHVAKPIDWGHLLGTIATLLEQRRSQRA